jgi:3-deoxy-D-manno-octulosonic-acid transferase
VYIFYSFLLFFALAALLPVYAFRLRLLKRESLHLGQRLGLRRPRRDPHRQAIWIHAVSVGEVLSLQNLVQQLRARHPSWQIFFSTLTNSGYRMAREKLKGIDEIFFVPFDFGWSVRRVLRAIRPSVLVLAESEFWPNLLRQARRHSTAVLVANGRVSDRSYRRYRRLKPLAARLWPCVDLFLVQTEQDRERLEALDVAASRVRVSGNLKTEVSLPELKPAEIARLKKHLSLPAKGKVVVAGSTRQGEEESLLEGFRRARQKRDDVYLILAPRHLDRVPEVEKTCRESGYNVCRKTRLRPGKTWDVLVLDTMGELARFYALCDAAFVGGSLVPWGGHNILEPAFYGKPVFFGPHMHNFAFLAETFVREGGGRIVQNREDLAALFLFKNERSLKAMGRRAKQTLVSLQGATSRTIQAIERFMDKKREPGPSTTLAQGGSG